MKRVIAIIMILVGVTCLGVGGYLNFMTGENDSDTSTKEDNGSPNNTKVNDDSLKLTDVKDYSEYSNYNLKLLLLLLVLEILYKYLVMVQLMRKIR